MKFSPRKIKAAFSYTLEELSQIFGVSQATVRSHLKPVPEAIIPGRPLLVVGRVLKDHLERSQGNPKQKKPSARFYCPSCKLQVRPFADLVDGEFSQARKQIILKALCPLCERGISKFASRGQLPQIEQDLGSHITVASQD